MEDFKEKKFSRGYFLFLCFQERDKFKIESSNFQWMIRFKNSGQDNFDFLANTTLKND